MKWLKVYENFSENYGKFHSNFPKNLPMIEIILINKQKRRGNSKKDDNCNNQKGNGRQ